MMSESIFTELELMQARIRFVPKGWSFSNIGKVFNICNNLRKPINEDERGKNLGEFPYYGPTKIQGYIGTYEQDGSYALIGEDGDHFLKFETHPMTQLVDGKCTVNNHAHIIEGTKKATREWFYYYFMHRDIFSFLSRQGAGRYKLNKASLEKMPLLIPPLPEQKKIAQILSTWDKAITTTEQLLANSQQQKKALMQQLLTGKKRLNGFGGEWRRLRLSHCAICLDNKRVPLNSEQRSSMLGSIPYWGANGVVDHINDFIFDQTIVMLAEDGGYFDEYETRSIANISHGKCWVNNHAHILVAKDNCLNEWLYYSLVHKNILAFVNGGTRAKLNKSDMLQILINLPDIEEQQAIVAVLSAADREIELLQQKLEGLKQEKKALMQQLLTGKRRVQA